MKGIGLIYRPGADMPEIHELPAPPTLEWLQAQVGGYIELVPGFDTISLIGTVRPCRVFCNENGKLDGMPVNLAATRRWGEAVKRAGGNLYAHDGRALDFLVGPILVLYGDAKFIAEL